MIEQSSHPEFPNIVGMLEQRLGDQPFGQALHNWEATIYSGLVIVALVLGAFLVSRRFAPIPGRLQAAVELMVGTLDDFVCGIIGEKGRKVVPFIGTLFIYILAMNLLGLVPFLKAATASLSVTAGLALCVFAYVQYTALKEFGFLGYLDHLAGRPRGVFAWSIVFPVMMFALHVVSEIVRPMSLSLRLRSNIWGDDMLLAVLAGFGLKWFPIYFVNVVMVVMSSVIQALVFTLLTTVYFSLVLTDEH